MSVAGKYTNEVLDLKRHTADELADDFISRCFSDTETRDSFYTWLRTSGDNSSMRNLPEGFSSEAVFINAVNFPSWADHKLLKRAADFFERYGTETMQLLGLLSLPYCYAAADGAMVLYLTERLRNDTGKRLKETGEFVRNVQYRNAFAENGCGFISILKTRLIHAVARYHLLKSERWEQGWGVPVNQEDLAGTQLAFSLIVIRGLRKLDFAVSDRDQQAVIHLWAVIGCLLGQDPEFVPRNGKEANLLEKLLREKLFRESKQGKDLTDALIDSITQMQPGTAISRKEIKQFMRFFLGDDLAKMLGIDDVALSFHIPLLLKSYYFLPGLRGFTID